MRQGTIQVYTGDGKGKTTAAFGLGLRAWGRGQRVLVIQFMKGGPPSGEVLAVQSLQGFQVLVTGTDRFMIQGQYGEEDLREAARGIEAARKAVREGTWNLVVLDEIHVAVQFGLVQEEDVLELMISKPLEMELILTGRNAQKSFLAQADLITEMKCLKHPYAQGLPAREGIER